MNWKLYHRLNDIYEYLYFLQKHYPDLAEVINIGDTVEGRPMLVLKIGSRKFSDKPAIFIEGGTYSGWHFEPFYSVNWHFWKLFGQFSLILSSHSDQGD